MYETAVGMGGKGIAVCDEGGVRLIVLSERWVELDTKRR